MENEGHEIEEAHEVWNKDLDNGDLEEVFDIDLNNRDKMAHEEVEGLELVLDMNLNNLDYKVHEELELDMVEYFHD